VQFEQIGLFFVMIRLTTPSSCSPDLEQFDGICTLSRMSCQEIRVQIKRSDEYCLISQSLANRSNIGSVHTRDCSFCLSSRSPEQLQSAVHILPSTSQCNQSSAFHRLMSSEVDRPSPHRMHTSGKTTRLINRRHSFKTIPSVFPKIADQTTGICLTYG
jgi:hypothetical protein